MTDAEIEKRAIGSPAKPVEGKRGELGRKITAELLPAGLDEGQAAGCVGAHGGNGRKLDGCPLFEVRVAAEGLEIQ